MNEYIVGRNIDGSPVYIWKGNMNNINEFVNHPSHYNKGKIEVIDFIEDQSLNFSRGSAVKYLCRAGYKDKSKEIEDLEKAVWYINREIERIKTNEQ